MRVSNRLTQVCESQLTVDVVEPVRWSEGLVLAIFMEDVVCYTMRKVELVVA
jgi:hypothetical protein